MIPLLMGVGEFAVVVFWCVLFHRRGFKRGYKSGYECGRLDSEKWWLQQGAEVEEMRKRIWKEEESRWP
jgi:hypothetical protein